MSILPENASQAIAPEAIALTGFEAASFTKISLKSLERAAERGEPVGRAKIGRRVIYLRDSLEAWLRSRVKISTQS